jgi:MYXO-CTERM domain-containing protein
VLGGQTVSISGQDFDEAVELRMDNDIVPVIFIDSNTLEFTSPTHDPGLADLRVKNPSGLEDLRSGAVLYVDTPAWPPEETGQIDSSDMDTAEDGGASDGKVGGCSCTATSGPYSGAWAFLLPLLVLIRRRK